MSKQGKVNTIPKERREYLRKVWYYECPCWDEAAYLKWYEELSVEDQGLINAWNKKYLMRMAPYEQFMETEEDLLQGQFSQKSCCRGCPFEGSGCNACFHDD